jgi:hypothetical protein
VEEGEQREAADSTTWRGTTSPGTPYRTRTVAVEHTDGDAIEFGEEENSAAASGSGNGRRR